MSTVCLKVEKLVYTLSLRLTSCGSKASNTKDITPAWLFSAAQCNMPRPCCEIIKKTFIYTIKIDKLQMIFLNQKSDPLIYVHNMPFSHWVLNV